MKNEKRLILPNQTLPVNLHLFFVPRTRVELWVTMIFNEQERKFAPLYFKY
jgi:hypothetical protein